MTEKKNFKRNGFELELAGSFKLSRLPEDTRLLTKFDCKKRGNWILFELARGSS